MKREKLVTINEANLKDELARVKGERDELRDLLTSLMDYMPSSWEFDRRAWPIGLTDKCRALLAKLEANKCRT